MDNDLFFGARFGINDKQSTEILMGTILDLDKTSRLYSVEANRRLGNSWKAEIEMRLFEKVTDQEFLYLFREDSFLEFSLGRYF